VNEIRSISFYFKDGKFHLGQDHEDGYPAGTYLNGSWYAAPDLCNIGQIISEFHDYFWQQKDKKMMDKCMFITETLKGDIFYGERLTLSVTPLRIIRLHELKPEKSIGDIAKQYKEGCF